MRPRRSRGIVLLALAPVALYAVGAGCNALTDTSTDTTTTTAGQPVLEIDPAAFLGGVLCADLHGAMRSYVVTFIDYGPDPDVLLAAQADGGTDSGIVVDPATIKEINGIRVLPGYPLVLPSSEPQSCSQRVAYVNGVTSHRYVADVDGYEEDVAALAALCSQKPSYAQCIGNLAAAPSSNGVCTRDADCKTASCTGTCKEADLEMPDANGTCQPVKDASKVKVCKYDAACSAGGFKCAGQPKAVAPIGAGTCLQDSDCLSALGCYGLCKKEPLQTLDNTSNSCVNLQGADGAQLQAGVCIYVPVLGDRHMVKPGTDTPVTPRWSTPPDDPCGLQNLVIAQDYERVSIGPCAPLLDRGSAAPVATSIRVVPTATLGPLACATGGNAGGTVTGFDITVDDVALGPLQHTDCDPATAVVYESGVKAGKSYTFTLMAYETGKTTPTRKATCFAAAKADFLSVAKCDPLVPIP